MIAFLQELGKLTRRGKAFWFTSFLFSSVLLVFGVFILVTQDEDANANAILADSEFNANAGSADANILTDEEFTTYLPTNAPTLSPSIEELTTYNYDADTHHPTVSAGVEVEPTQVASPVSFHPSAQTDLPSEEPSELPSQPATMILPTTISPTVAPTTSPITFPTAHPTHVPTTSSSPTASSPTGSPYPTMTNTPTQSPLFPTHDEPNQSIPTFFNYNMSESSRYGPHSWSNVTVLNSTENYWYEFGFVANECSKGAQSPIDVCTQPVRHCEEYHEFRAKVNDIVVYLFNLPSCYLTRCTTLAHSQTGDFRISSSEVVEKQILPNKLRALMMRRIGEEPDPPHVDFSGVGYANLDLLNIDIKIPAEHHVCGKRYDGEMQYYFFHPVKQSLIAVSWLFEAKQGNLANQHMQLLIDEFQKVYDGNDESCKANMTTTTTTAANTTTIQNQSGTAAGSAPSTSTRALGSARNRQMKKEREPVWDPFHSDIQRTVHFWGYRGSLTEPPCSPDSVLWRIMDVPVPISEDQLFQMQNILFNNRDRDSCAFTSTHYKGSVARPISKSIRYYKCTRSDYVSDNERDLCGDLGCEIPFGKDLDHYFEPIVHVTGPPSYTPTALPSISPTVV
jgi:hypothetical protein